MKEDLITIETAKMAKGKGFNLKTQYAYCDIEEHTLYDYHHGNEEIIPKVCDKLLSTEYYDKYKTIKYSAPTQTLLQKWLRKTHDIHIVLPVDPYSKEIELYSVKVYKDSSGMRCVFTNEEEPKRYQYEDALEIGLQEALKLITL